MSQTIEVFRSGVFQQILMKFLSKQGGSGFYLLPTQLKMLPDN